MNLSAILELLRQTVGAGKLTDATKWSVLSVQSKGATTAGTLTSITVDPVLFTLSCVVDSTIDESAMQFQLKAEPHSPRKAKVSVNGDHDPDAALIFDYHGSIGNTSRWGFDFDHVTVDGQDYRINLRFDP